MDKNVDPNPRIPPNSSMYFLKETPKAVRESLTLW